MSKIVTKATLDEKVVELVDSFGGLEFYKHVGADDSITLFLVSRKTGDVLRKIEVEADCSHNSGYVSDIKFSDY